MNHDLIKSTLQKLLEELGLRVDGITITEEDDLTRAEIASPDASRIIGWHGETLNALQHLVKSIVRTAENLERTPFIILDVDGYRRMQEDKVRAIAEQKADFVRRTSNRIALQPMSPYFRRIVHMHIAATPALADLATESVGEGDYRQVVIQLKNARPTDEAPSEELSPILAADDGLENLDV